MKSSLKPSFVSYVKAQDPEECTNQQPSLLPGELVIGSARRVAMLSMRPGDESGGGPPPPLPSPAGPAPPSPPGPAPPASSLGHLVCTNFRVSFTPSVNQAGGAQRVGLRNLLLGDYDVSLTGVDSVYVVVEGRRKAVTPGSVLRLPESLIIHCKDFRVLRFSLEFTEPAQARKVINAIVHHSRPSSLRLLFAFEYLRATQDTSSPPNSPPTSSSPPTVMFHSVGEWEREMERVGGAPGWRVTQLNEHFKFSKSLPECFVIPAVLSDREFKEASAHFRDERGPVWCWSHPNGASLVKMSLLRPDSDSASLERRMLGAVPACDLRSVHEVCLCQQLARPSDTHTAFSCLKRVCLCDASDVYWAQDNKWLSLLDASGWLQQVRQYLLKAVEVAEELCNQRNVVLRESDGRDATCVISSLVQILLDPHCRTISGFQSLIQKEWVVHGHKFLDRLHHLNQMDSEEAPVFQLFLDCVWQLGEWSPRCMEPSATMLCVLSDSAHLPLFSTFLFNCEFHRQSDHTDISSERYIRSGGARGSVPSVWEWGLQFAPETVRTHLYNPLYRLLTPTASTNPPSFLPPIPRLLATAAHHLRSSPAAGPRLWSQRYLRWLPDAVILGGGAVSATRRALALAGDVAELARRCRQLAVAHGDGHGDGGCGLYGATENNVEVSAMVIAGHVANAGVVASLPSTFPFLPLGMLGRRGGAAATPLQRLLFGRSVSAEILTADE